MVDQPLGEEAELYSIQISQGGVVLETIDSLTATCSCPAGQIVGWSLTSDVNLDIVIRQIGTFAISAPLNISVAVPD